MPRWEITEQRFKNLVDYKSLIKKSNCKEGPREGVYGGILGHEECGGYCPGNYYNRGECNFGGRHVLSEELDMINSNFQGIAELEDEHQRLRVTANLTQEKFEEERNRLVNNFNRTKENCENPSRYLFATCIGVEGKGAIFQRHALEKFKEVAEYLDNYIKRVKELKWFQVKEFQDKINEIQKKEQENNQLSEELVDPNTSESRKREIVATIEANNQEIKAINEELNKHPAFPLFDPRVAKELRGIVNGICDSNQKKLGLGESKGRVVYYWNGEREEGNKDDKKTGKGDNNSLDASKIFLYASLGILAIIFLIIAYFTIVNYFRS